MTSPYSAIIQMRIDCSLSEWKGAEGHCQWCDKSLAGQSRRKVWCSKECGQAFENNHIWNIARHKARKRARYSCTREGCPNPKENLEVNHIDPLVGAGYGPSCFHHASNLEVLCKAHHQIETNRQRAERKEIKIQEDELAKHVKVTHFIEAHNNLDAQTYSGEIFGGTFLYDSELSARASQEPRVLNDDDSILDEDFNPTYVGSHIILEAPVIESAPIAESKTTEAPVFIPEWLARRSYVPMMPRHPGDSLPGAVITYQPVVTSTVPSRPLIQRPKYPKKNKVPKRPQRIQY